jgi:hypothetical protein
MQHNSFYHKIDWSKSNNNFNNHTCTMGIPQSTPESVEEVAKTTKSLTIAEKTELNSLTQLLVVRDPPSCDFASPAKEIPSFRLHNDLEHFVCETPGTNVQIVIVHPNATHLATPLSQTVFTHENIHQRRFPTHYGGVVLPSPSCARTLYLTRCVSESGKNPVVCSQMLKSIQQAMRAWCQKDVIFFFDICATQEERDFVDEFKRAFSSFVAKQVERKNALIPNVLAAYQVV